MYDCGILLLSSIPNEPILRGKIVMRRLRQARSERAQGWHDITAINENICDTGCALHILAGTSYGLEFSRNYRGHRRFSV